MERNLIITGAAGNLGKAVVEKFKREGYRVIATVLPGSGESVEEADDVYEVDVTDETAVKDFANDYVMQYGEVDAIGLLVGGYAGGDIEHTGLEDLDKMIKLNFYSAFTMVKSFLPLMKKDGLGEYGEKIFNDLKFDFNMIYEDKDSIGKRYRRQDAIGTPFCITVDHDSLVDHTVTLRDRDTMKQERVPVADLRRIIDEKTNFRNLLSKI